MWVGDYLARECGVEIYTSPQQFRLNGKNVFIAHGDNMNIDGQPVLKFLNTVFRSRTLRWLFSWLLHPDLAMRFGHWWSGKSRKSHGAEELDVSLTEPLIEYARRYAAEHDVDHFVFGHMHFPRDYREQSLHVINLGCWEKYPSCAVLDASGGMTLKMLERGNNTSTCCGGSKPRASSAATVPAPAPKASSDTRCVSTFPKASRC